MSEVIKAMFGGSTTKQETATDSEGWQQSSGYSNPLDLNPMDFQKIRGAFSDLLLGNAKDPRSYKGPFNADLTSREAGVLDELLPMTGAGTDRAGYLKTVLQGNFLPGQGGNPHLDAAIRSAQRPTMDALTEVLGRTLPGRFTQAGQFIQPQGSSAFDRAAAIATRGAADAIGDIATKMSFGNYESERNRQQQAVQLSREEVGASIENLKAQGLPRMIQEMGIERGMVAFQQTTQALLEVLKMLGAVTGANIAQQSATQSSGGTRTRTRGSGSGSSYNGIFTKIPLAGGPGPTGGGGPTP